MPTGRKRGKKASPVQEEVPSPSADPNDDSEPEFDSIEETLEQSLSYESLTWMRHVIRVQAREVVRDILKQEREKNGTLQKNEGSEMASLKQEITDLKESNKQMQVKLEEYQSEIKKLKWARDGINKELGRKTSQIEHLTQSLDSLEQKQNETRVRITGIAEEEDENLTKKILDLAKKKMGLKKLKDSDIVQIHRSGKKKSTKTRDVIVQFESKLTRDSLHSARKKLHESNSAHRKVYINDDLTVFRQKLLYDARILVKKGKLKGAWAQNGNIMVLVEQSKPKAVYNYRDLRKISGLDFYESSSSISDQFMDDELDFLSQSSI